jgi:hypothetical protein
MAKNMAMDKSAKINSVCDKRFRSLPILKFILKRLNIYVGNTA